jgi:hypothetical protein
VNAKFDTKVTAPTDSVNSSLNLTTMKDDVAKVTLLSNNPFHNNLKSLNPYPDQQLQTVLSRSYKIRSFAWGTAVAGTLLEQIPFPKALFEIQASQAPTFQTNTNLVDKLSSFRYFRSKVKVSIRINATKFHYGLLGITWLPHYYSVAAGTGLNFPYKNHTVYQAMNNNAMLFSANDTSTLEFEIPWITPYQYMDLLRYADTATNPTWESFIGQLQIWVLNPLRNAQGVSGTSSVRISVQAQFVDPVVTGMVPFKYISTCPPAAFTEDFEPQMDQEQMDKTLKGIVSGVRETKKGVQEFVSSMPIIANAASEAIGFMETVGLDKPHSLAAPCFINKNLAPDLCFGNGLETTDVLALDPQNSVTISPRLFSQTEEAMDYLAIARKPSLFKLNSFNSASIEGSLMELWPVTPSLCHKDVPDFFEPTYLAYISSPFTFWKGSLKYMVYFSASQFSTARVRFSWLPSEPTTTTPFEYGSGDFLSKVVDITGDTIVEVTVPYVNPYYLLEVGHFEDETATALPPVAFNGYVMMHVYNAPITVESTGDSDIYYSCFIAGGEDYTLHKPKSIYQTYNPPYITGPPEVEAAPEEPEIPLNDLEAQYLVLNQEFKKQFEPLIRDTRFGTHHRIVDGDRLDSSLRTIIHRYSDLADVTQTGGTPFTIIRNMYPLDGAGNSPVTTDDWRNFQYFSYLFMFWRGSIRYKLLWKDGASANVGSGLALLVTENQVTGYVPNNDAFNGASAWNGDYRPSIEIQLPFYHQIAFQPLHPRVLDPDVSAPRFRVRNETNVVDGRWYVSAGDDFTYGVLSSPPLIRVAA